jgi:hypothetical protein
MLGVVAGRPFGGLVPRELNWAASGKDTPPPDTYSPVLIAAPRSPANGQFGTDRITFPEALIKNPGPGSYEKSGATVRDASAGLQNPSRSPNLWDVRITPAPGQYEEFVAERVARTAVSRVASPAFKDRTARYQCLENPEPNPGPAYYAKMPRMAKGPREFKKEERFTLTNYSGGQKLSDTPSPAGYNIETELGKKRAPGGAIRYGQRGDKEPKNRKIGPGRYSIMGGEMVKGSFNIHFDAQLKHSTKYRIGGL